MKRSLQSVVALGLMAVLPATALAQGHPGGGGGGHAPAPAAPHPAAPPMSRPAAPAISRPAPENQGGFGLPHDINPHPAPVQHPIPPQHPIAPPPEHPVAPPPHTVTRPVPPPERPGQPVTQPQHPVAPNHPHGSPATYPHAPYNQNVSGGPYHGNFHGPVIRNPHNWGGWQWNHGVAWQRAPIYWGGGFWGPFAIATLGGAALFGSIVDYQNQEIYPSYQVTESSPGAQLLENYGLTQTECGPPNLVVIWGPDNSVICAYPNNLVAPGNYELDPSTLTIVSSSQQ